MGEVKEKMKITAAGGSNFRIDAADGSMPQSCIVIADSYMRTKMTDGKLSKAGNGYILAVLPKDVNDFHTYVIPAHLMPVVGQSLTFYLLVSLRQLRQKEHREEHQSQRHRRQRHRRHRNQGQWHHMHRHQMQQHHREEHQSQQHQMQRH